jgi:undecaprenyl-diphosphatase
MSCELKAPGWLARHLPVAMSIVLLGGLIFGALAYQIQSNGPMIQWDIKLESRLHSTAVKTPGPINEVLTYGFFLGKEDLQLLAAILVVYFLHKRFWEELGMVLVGWVGGSFIWTPLVYYFNRPRPQEQLGIEVRIPSFPSGHSMFALLALGLLGYLLIPQMPSLFWKWVIGLGTLLLILFVGFSRIFQGGHYLSDVLAGYSLALAWGSLVYAILEFIAIKRRA